MIRARIVLAAVAVPLSWASSDKLLAAPVEFQQVASGLDRPVFATHAPGDTERLFIVEKTGTIKILHFDGGAVTTFLNVPDTDSSANEEGLLGLAFHPDYQTNGKFYINVTVDNDANPENTQTHIRQYTVSSNPDIANTTFESVLIFNQPQSNHNGGWMGFSPNDGYLYIMSGDGGGANDTGTGHTAGTGNAQDITNNLLGKVLRIDVDGTNGSTGNYGNPATNPFVGVTGDDEIWAYGLRNPWRASFDRVTGDLWMGDVGQSNREEINFQPADSEGGENYGWRIMEGSFKNPAYASQDPPDPNKLPIYDYGRGNGEFQGGSTVGGYVYRGPDPELQGTYFFADSLSSNIWTLVGEPGNIVVDNVRADLPPDTGTLNALVSFGEDAVGNLYLVKLGSGLNQPPLGTGAVYKLITDAVVPGDFDGNGVVDGDDLDQWQLAYGVDSDGDADGDGDSDGADFLIWQRNFGVTAQNYVGVLSAVTVPEPTTIGMTILLPFIFTRNHSRRR